MSYPVYTYYMPVPGIWGGESSQLALIEVWKRSWKKAGWNPIVLDVTWVQDHPKYSYFKEKFWYENQHSYEFNQACFFRWFAAAVAGGGMLTDFDVINYGFTPRNAIQDRMILFCDEPPQGIFLGAVLGSQNHFEKMIDIFANWVIGPNEEGWATQRYVYNDLLMVTKLFDGSSVYPKPSWFVKENGCALFDYLSWKTARLVHYSNNMLNYGYWPKHEWIERIRPF